MMVVREGKCRMEKRGGKTGEGTRRAGIEGRMGGGEEKKKR